MKSNPRLERGDTAQVGLAIAIDDDSATLYAEYGVPIELADDHPFVIAEHAAWAEAAAAGRLVFAFDPALDATPVAFATLGFLDGEAYLDQLSVRRVAMRRGLGSALLDHALAWARTEGSPALWLTTYSHLPFNRPFYERAGFALVPPPHRPELAEVLSEQRDVLPDPEQRVAMRRLLES